MTHSSAPPPFEPSDDIADEQEDDGAGPACVLVFNANDPSGAGGLAADATAIASVGAHALTIVTGSYARDTAEIFEHYCFDEEAVAEQARAVLEDVAVQVIKVGFVGSPENISAIAELAADYADRAIALHGAAYWSTQHDAALALHVHAARMAYLGDRSALRRQVLRRGAVAE